MSVIDMILDRRKSGSIPGQREDSARIALVIEGGGMRGVITGGMAAAIERLGLTACFDGVFGSSAGAMAGAFLLAGNAAAGVTVYYDHINNHRFINVLRLLMGRGAMDLDFLVHDVFDSGVPLNCEVILTSPIPLHIVATDVSDGSAAVLADFASPNDVLDALKASACNPLGGGAPVEVGGNPYWDAFLSESIPLGVAQDSSGNC
jgi:predicted patatin/cPLA2 family phospholipase